MATKKTTKSKTEKANEKAEQLDKATAGGDSKDGSFDKTPTAPQIQTTAGAPIASSAEGVDTKSVRHDVPPGAGPGAIPTTIKEETVILDKGPVSEDRDGMIQAMRVRAQTQGINQTADLGKEGVLTVYQDGSHSIDQVPEFEKDPD